MISLTIFVIIFLYILLYFQISCKLLSKIQAAKNLRIGRTVFFAPFMLSDSSANISMKLNLEKMQVVIQKTPFKKETL